MNENCYCEALETGILCQACETELDYGWESVDSLAYEEDGWL